MCNPSVQGMEPPWWGWGQPGLHSETMTQRWIITQWLNISLKRFTLFIFTYCVCTLEHTTTHVEARGWLTRTSSQPLMSSGKQTQASKQLAPLPTELSSAHKSLGAWCLTGAESWGLPCVERSVASLPRKISLFQRVANKPVGWGAKPPPDLGTPT